MELWSWLNNRVAESLHGSNDGGERHKTLREQRKELIRRPTNLWGKGEPSFCVNGEENSQTRNQRDRGKENPQQWNVEPFNFAQHQANEQTLNPHSGQTICYPKARCGESVSMVVFYQQNVAPTNNGITKVVVSKREWWHMALPPWLNVQHSPSLSFGIMPLLKLVAVNIACWVI